MPRDIAVTDPRGRMVRCSAFYWETHVLRRHATLKDCEKHAEQAIRTPRHDCIYQDKKYPDRHIYYGSFKGAIEIKVVVAFESDKEGKVVSVIPVSRRPEGEKLIWHKE